MNRRLIAVGSLVKSNNKYESEKRIPGSRLKSMADISGKLFDVDLIVKDEESDYDIRFVHLKGTPQSDLFPIDCVDLIMDPNGIDNIEQRKKMIMELPADKRLKNIIVDGRQFTVAVPQEWLNKDINLVQDFLK